VKHALSVPVLLLVAATPAAAQRRPVTVDDILGMKVVGSPMVSPDGAQVIYTVRQWQAERDRMESRTHIWKVPVAGGPARQITFGERGDAQPQWSPDGRSISFVSARGPASGDEPPRGQIYVMPVDGGEAWKLTDAGEGVVAYAWAPDSSRIAYVSLDPRSADVEAAARKRDDERVFEGNFRSQHLWTVDLASKSAVRVTSGSAYTVTGGVSWAPDGRQIVFAARTTPMLRDVRSDIYVVDAGTGAVEKISTNPGSDAQPQWSPDGTAIAWISEPADARPLADGTLPAYIGISHLTLYDVGTRTIKDVASRDFDLEAGTPHWTADGRRILFVTGRRTYTEAFSFDVATGQYTQLSRQRTLQYGSRSRDGRVIAVTMDTPAMPGEIYATDEAFAAFRKLTDTNPQAAAFALGESEVVRWKSSDGLEIEGVLLKPVGYAAGARYPMLVVAHGGPAGAFTNGYRVGGLEGGQLWAGQGWAVFYPNPRGSANYGERFVRANINDWGGGDYRDIMTGVDALVARGVADPDRLAHIGWSYGGYMTAWVITQTTRFRAAMVGAGLTNMVSMYGTNDIPNVLVSYFGGIPGKNSLPLYTARSAMTFIDNVRTPTLILHGASDERVPPGQAHELYRALKDRGMATELVLYPREGHGISEYYHLKDRLTRIFDWVTRYVAEPARTTTR
jgi:dipeptidyl aminopeptidase/acylaminoacyl peptidase